MNKITSLQNPYIKELAKLNSKKNILKDGFFLIEGKNVITEAYQKGRLEKLLITDLTIFKTFNLEKILVTKGIIAKISANVSNTEAVGICKIIPNSPDFNSYKKVILLDGINDPGNFGTIIRTAYAFNFDAIFTINDSVFEYNSKVIRATQGALFDIPIYHLETLEKLKDYKTFRFVINKKAKELHQIENSQEKVLLVFGNEANGIDPKTLEILKGEDVFIKINNIDSLNVAISAGIAMERFKN